MSIANEKQPLPRARMRRNGAIRLMDAAALAVLAGWLVLALGVWYPQYAAGTAAAASGASPPRRSRSRRSRPRR